MKIEQKLIEFISDSEFNDLPEKSVNIVKYIVLGITGTVVAGSSSDESLALIDYIREWGGKQESTILVYGNQVPGHAAALANGTMAQALDYDDAVVPGVHIGCVAVPAALAAAEIAGGCNGRDFLTALVAGIEIANRINMVNLHSFYGGFHGTGICGTLAATAAAGRILGINSTQMWNALGLALNKMGGSGQNNIEGAQAVSLVAGFAAESGILCAQLAQKGITGPQEFIEGSCGWLKMFGTDKLDPEKVTGELGTRFELNRTLFKKHPSCGLTQTSTEGILDLVREKGITVEDVDKINIRVGPFAHTVVGHFHIGDSPRVNAQFSVPYCVASALLRKNSSLRFFEESFIREPVIEEVIKKISVIPDPEIEKREQRAMEMDVYTRQGKVYHKRIDIPRGSPGNEMTREEHLARFRECTAYGNRPLSPGKTEKVISFVDNLESANNICDLIPLLVI